MRSLVKTREVFEELPEKSIQLGERPTSGLVDVPYSFHFMLELQKNLKKAFFSSFAGSPWQKSSYVGRKFLIWILSNWPDYQLIHKNPQNFYKELFQLELKGTEAVQNEKGTLDPHTFEGQQQAPKT